MEVLWVMGHSGSVLGCSLMHRVTTITFTIIAVYLAGYFIMYEVRGGIGKVCEVQIFGNNIYAPWPRFGSSFNNSEYRISNFLYAPINIIYGNYFARILSE